MKLHDVTQRMLEKYEDGKVKALSEVPNLSVKHFNRLLIDIAVEAGIASDIPSDMDNCKPYEIMKLTEDLVTHIIAAQAPPDPN